MNYISHPERYEQINYRRCGQSGLLLPELSLGMWHNFGDVDSFDEAKAMTLEAFDQGITHFDLANNYGPPPGSAEETLGKILSQELKEHRDELIISTKAGWRMWPGPYGEFGSRKYLIASLDQSLRRLGLDYVDIYYSHRPDPQTPFEETMGALAQIVQAGKALYVGISSYNAVDTQKCVQILKSMGVPCLIHQARYSMLARDLEIDLLDTIHQNGMGCIGFSPLAQGLLSGKYLNGIPQESRAARPDGHLQSEWIQDSDLQKIAQLQVIAKKRNQTLSQMAIAWTLRDPRMTSTIIGPRNLTQLKENLGALNAKEFSDEELRAIDQVLGIRTF